MKKNYQGNNSEEVEIIIHERIKTDLGGRRIVYYYDIKYINSGNKGEILYGPPAEITLGSPEETEHEIKNVLRKREKEFGRLIKIKDLKFMVSSPKNSPKKAVRFQKSLEDTLKK